MIELGDTKKGFQLQETQSIKFIKYSTVDKNNTIPDHNAKTSSMPKFKNQAVPAQKINESTNLYKKDRVVQKKSSQDNFSKVETKSQIARRQAIALEVLVKFDNSMKEFPPIMSMDIKKDKNYKLVSCDFERRNKGKIEFAFFEPEPITKNEQIDMVRETLQAARRQRYQTVAQALGRNSSDLTITEITQEGIDPQIPRIMKIINLSVFDKLEKLNLRSNRIRKIDDLGSLPSLTHLQLSQNQISKIENLYRLTSLKELYLNRNQIKKIEDLDTLTQLTVLNLCQNNITIIEQLHTLTKLKILLLMGNKIRKIEELQDLTNIQILDLSQNQITTIQNLDNLYSLKILNLRNNFLSKIQNVYMIKSGATLYLGGNPIDKNENNFMLTSMLGRKINLVV